MSFVLWGLFLETDRDNGWCLFYIACSICGGVIDVPGYDSGTSIWGECVQPSCYRGNWHPLILGWDLCFVAYERGSRRCSEGILTQHRRFLTFSDSHCSAVFLLECTGYDTWRKSPG